MVLHKEQSSPSLSSVWPHCLVGMSAKLVRRLFLYLWGELQTNVRRHIDSQTKVQES